MEKQICIGWWSAGITSAVACKLAIEAFPCVRLIYADTGSAHSDNNRFKQECEKWYGQEIETHKNEKYVDHFDVIYKERYINGPDGAKCTKELKKRIRWRIEDDYAITLFNSTTISHQIFGYEWETHQVNRAIRFLQQYPAAKGKFPLIERKLNKDQCAGILLNAGIKIPKMYELGYPNNNCIGCVKGGKGYWNKIRMDFPNQFSRMVEAERHLSHTCIKDVYLDELDPNEGKEGKIVLPNCGTFCELELADIPVHNIEQVMGGKLNIYEAS
ncbi:MAG: phosphoadenosine phosphosulfate reductase family protein [Agriterribacter sp.]